MKKAAAIRKLIAALLLLVFLIASAPKAWFHDFFASHSDMPACPLPHHGVLVHAQGFNCHFDDLVVTAPFFLAATSCELPPQTFCIPQQSHDISFFFPAFEHHSDSRGPPCI